MKAKDYIIIGGAVALFLLWQKNKGKKSSASVSETSTAGASEETSASTPTSTEPEQVFGLGLPAGINLPASTAGTGVPTEVAVQQGGVVTTPTPAIVPVPALQIEESLALGGIKPIVKPLPLQALPIKTEPIKIELIGAIQPVKTNLYTTKI